MAVNELKRENFPSQVFQPTCFPQSSSQVPSPTCFQEHGGWGAWLELPQSQNVKPPNCDGDSVGETRASSRGMTTRLRRNGLSGDVVGVVCDDVVDGGDGGGFGETVKMTTTLRRNGLSGERQRRSKYGRRQSWNCKNSGDGDDYCDVGENCDVGDDDDDDDDDKDEDEDVEHWMLMTMMLMVTVIVIAMAMAMW